MKTLLTILAITFTIGNAHAAIVRDVKSNTKDGTIDLAVSYGGGCRKHEFRLEQVGGCTEARVIGCTFQLIEEANGDMCEAYIHQTVRFTFEELGLNNSYYDWSTITIKGDNDTSVVFGIKRGNH